MQFNSPNQVQIVCWQSVRGAFGWVPLKTNGSIKRGLGQSRVQQLTICLLRVWVIWAVESGKWKVTMKTGLIGGSFWLQFGEHRNGHTLKCVVLCCFGLGQRFLFIGI